MDNFEIGIFSYYQISVNTIFLHNIKIGIYLNSQYYEYCTSTRKMVFSFHVLYYYPSRYTDPPDINPLACFGLQCRRLSYGLQNYKYCSSYLFCITIIHMSNLSNTPHSCTVRLLVQSAPQVYLFLKKYLYFCLENY